MLRFVATWWCAAVLVLLASAPPHASAQAPRVVHVVPIEGTIDLGLAPFVQRVLDEAVETGAAAVVLEIDTFGGRVDAAVRIRDALLRTPVRTIAYVDKRAISAGALIGLAAQTIAMSGGSTIGAATPVVVGSSGRDSRPADEKSVSYVRKEFRATAESRERPTAIAEAMVDADVAVPGLVEKGKLLTLTTAEALEHGVADFRAESLDAVLERSGLAGAEVRRHAPNWAENLVRLLTDPVVASLLISLGMLGLLIELRTPGLGVPGAVGVGSLALFFWGHWLVELAGWEELLVVAAGVVLIAIELLVIPGFGIVGVLGIAALIGGFVLSLVGAQDTHQDLIEAAVRVVLALVGAILAGLVAMRFLPRLPFGRRLVLEQGLPAGGGYTSAPADDRRWLGRTGTAATPLHPAGIAEIDGERVDVVSTGDLVDAGQPVEVIRVDGNRVVVRALRPPPPKE